MARALSIEQRFWARVNKTNVCWLWTASGNGQGYGKDAYRWPQGCLFIMRTGLVGSFITGQFPKVFACFTVADNGECVNPAHLFLGTHAANMADMAAKGRHADVKGEAHNRVKLTNHQVLDIRSRRNQSTRALAAEFGVSHAQIGGIRRGVYWSHLGP